MAKKKYIDGPEKLWELFKEYQTWAKSNPFKIIDWVGGTGKEVSREKERPLTMSGFENYCFENGIIADLGDYFKNKDNRYDTYAPICRACKNSIRADQLDGGLAGIYSTSITQRLNGLTEKSENEVTITGFDISLKL